MPSINAAVGEINIKITYHGPAFAGSTTNLQYIYNKTQPEQKGKMVSLRSAPTWAS